MCCCNRIISIVGGVYVVEVQGLGIAAAMTTLSELLLWMASGREESKQCLTCPVDHVL